MNNDSRSARYSDILKSGISSLQFQSINSTSIANTATNTVVNISNDGKLGNPTNLAVRKESSRLSMIGKGYFFNECFK